MARCVGRKAGAPATSYCLANVCLRLFFPSFRRRQTHIFMCERVDTATNPLIENSLDGVDLENPWNATGCVEDSGEVPNLYDLDLTARPDLTDHGN